MGQEKLKIIQGVCRNFNFYKIPKTYIAMNLKKDQKDWKTTAGNIPDKNNKRKRNYKHNHRCSIVRHNDGKIENCWIEYFKFMETNSCC